MKPLYLSASDVHVVSHCFVKELILIHAKKVLLFYCNVDVKLKEAIIISLIHAELLRNAEKNL